MADYIAGSACNGCKPRHLRGRICHQRSGLLSLMIQKRDVARFLIAPTGFGKTTLAAEYAESIFGFQDVFWLNARSPCFLRDVDRGTIASSLGSMSRRRSLVVIEDLPRLTAARAEEVSACIDKLLERGWEIIVTMVPLYRAFADRQPDGIRIRSKDFIVTEDEMRSLVSETGIGPRKRLPASPSDGVPGLLWGGSCASLDLLRGAADDALPTDALLGLFVMLTLGRGSIEDAEAFSGPLKSDTRALLGEEYLFLGIDEHAERFETYPFSADEVVQAFSGSLARMAASSPFAYADALVSRLADALLFCGAAERACAIVDGCCNGDARIAWLDARSKELARAGCLLPAHRLFESKMLRLNAQTASVFAGEAWRLVGLDDVPAAIALAGRVLDRSAAPDAVRASAALLLARFGGAEDRTRAVAALGCMVHRSCGCDPPARAAAVAEALEDEGRYWEALAQAVVWLAEDARAAVRLAEACLRCGRVGDPETGILLWSLGALTGEGTCLVECASEADVERVLSIAGDYLRRSSEKGRFDYGSAALLGAWDKARAFSAADAPYPALSAERTAAQTLGMQLFSQRSAFERERRSGGAARSAAARPAGQPRIGDAAQPAVRRFGGASMGQVAAVPTLNVRLFGGLDVSIGENEVEPSLFRRQKVKTLLALLTLNQGKEILRDRLAAILWPTSSIETARRNFYSTWSMLRRALTVPDSDECPYLVRLQYSCKLDTRTVASDVAEFDELCNKLLLEPPDIEAWSAIYARLSELYRGDLLPSEGRNEFIVRQREEYRARLIDALVSASTRLFEGGELQAALWFAHAAVRRDSTREDAYTALMQAQVAAGQRTAALDTYFKCKRYLSDELGIDPSPKAVMLYSSIIEAEPNLKGFTPKP